MVLIGIRTRITTTVNYTRHRGAVVHVMAYPSNYAMAACFVCIDFSQEKNQPPIISDKSTPYLLHTKRGCFLLQYKQNRSASIDSHVQRYYMQCVACSISFVRHSVVVNATSTQSFKSRLSSVDLSIYLKYPFISIHWLKAAWMSLISFLTYSLCTYCFIVSCD